MIGLGRTAENGQSARIAGPFVPCHATCPEANDAAGTVCARSALSAPACPLIPFATRQKRRRVTRNRRMCLPSLLLPPNSPLASFLAVCQELRGKAHAPSLHRPPARSDGVHLKEAANGQDPARYRKMLAGRHPRPGSGYWTSRRTHCTPMQAIPANWRNRRRSQGHSRVGPEGSRWPCGNDRADIQAQIMITGIAPQKGLARRRVCQKFKLRLNIHVDAARP